MGSAFATWSDVAEWLAAQAEPAARLTPAIAARAASLVRNQADPIRALAAFVQRLRYVAVNVNPSGGGGFVPRDADAVLAQGFGDCKDKANLLRTLLRAEESSPGSSPSTRRIGNVFDPNGLRLACSTMRFSPSRHPTACGTSILPIRMFRSVTFPWPCKTLRPCSSLPERG